MQEDFLEEELMDKEFPPHRDLGAKEEEERFPHYVQLRRAKAEPVTLPTKANKVLVAS